mmetsp:Transcript_3268/g.8070  ORF Transcript_3268/g.8070 Transcript_3268/m.8070 type:complete len:213 (-) Transcript_3268:171-809(-)
MLRCDCSADGGRTRTHKIHRITRGDVLQHNLQVRESVQDPSQGRFDEDLLPVEDVYLRISHFAVDQQDHAGRFHRLKSAVASLHVSDSGRRVGRGPGRVKLEADNALFLRFPNLIGRRIVGEVQGHQWVEAALRHALGDLLKYSVAVLEREVRRGDGRHQVRHDDGPGEVSASVRNDIAQNLSVPHVQMPVVWDSHGQTRDGFSFLFHCRLP